MFCGLQLFPIITLILLLYVTCKLKGQNNTILLFSIILILYIIKLNKEQTHENYKSSETQIKYKDGILTTLKKIDETIKMNAPDIAIKDLGKDTGFLDNLSVLFETDVKKIQKCLSDQSDFELISLLKKEYNITDTELLDKLKTKYIELIQKSAVKCLIGFNSADSYKAKISKYINRLNNKSKDSPKEDVKEVPKEDVKDSPKEDVKEVPKEDVKDSPKEDVKEVPKEDVKEVPKEDVKEVPKENTIHYSPKMSELDIINLKKGQEKITSILKNINDINVKNNITYLIYDSTLSGSNKYNGWIPWENEATILILEQDYDKFIKVANQELTKDTWVQHKNVDPAYKCNYIARIKDLNSCYNSINNNNLHDGLHVNINTFTIIDDNIKINNCKKLYKYNDFMPLKTSKFENLKLPIPNKADEIIKLNDWDKDIPILERIPQSKLEPTDSCDFHKTQYAALY